MAAARELKRKQEEEEANKTRQDVAERLQREKEEQERKRVFERQAMEKVQALEAHLHQAREEEERQYQQTLQLIRDQAKTTQEYEDKLMQELKTLKRQIDPSWEPALLPEDEMLMEARARRLRITEKSADESVILNLQQDLQTARQTRIKIETQLEENIGERLKLEMRLQSMKEENERLKSEVDALQKSLQAVREDADDAGNIHSEAARMIRESAMREKSNAVEESISHSTISTTVEPDGGTIDPSSLLRQVDKSTRPPAGPGEEDEDDDPQIRILGKNELGRIVEEKTKMMAGGATFIRHFTKNNGKPQKINMFYREFLITSASTRDPSLYLVPSGHALDRTAYQLPLAEVTHIYLGKQTQAFRRKICKKIREHLCFSIATCKGTYDFEARGTSLRDGWVIGIMGMLRSKGQRVALHRVPAFINIPICGPGERGSPLRVELMVKCRAIPKVRMMGHNRKPLVQLFEHDSTTGKYHFVDQTEQASNGGIISSVLDSCSNPIFVKKLIFDYCPGLNQTLCFTVSYSSNVEKLKYSRRLGHCEFRADELVNYPGKEFEFALRNPQKKTFNRLLMQSQAIVVASCVYKPDQAAIDRYKEEILANKPWLLGQGPKPGESSLNENSTNAELSRFASVSYGDALSRNSFHDLDSSYGGYVANTNAPVLSPPSYGNDAPTFANTPKSVPYNSGNVTTLLEGPDFRSQGSSNRINAYQSPHNHEQGVGSGVAWNATQPNSTGWTSNHSPPTHPSPAPVGDGYPGSTSHQPPFGAASPATPTHAPPPHPSYTSSNSNTPTRPPPLPFNHSTIHPSQPTHPPPAPTHAPPPPVLSNGGFSNGVPEASSLDTELDPFAEAVTSQAAHATSLAQSGALPEDVKEMQRMMQYGRSLTIHAVRSLLFAEYT